MGSIRKGILAIRKGKVGAEQNRAARAQPPKVSKVSRGPPETASHPTKSPQHKGTDVQL